VIEMMSTSGGGEQVLVAGRDAGLGQGEAVLLEVRAGAVRIAAAEPGDGCVRVPLEGGDVLRGAPPDPGDADAERAVTSRHLRTR
jgi:hypothetical protein